MELYSIHDVEDDVFKPDVFAEGQDEEVFRISKGKEELDPEIFADAKVFVDDMEHCIEAGEVEIPVKKGIVSEADVREIGELILGRCEGRTSDTDITIYDPAGMALLDIAAAKVVLDLAEEKGLGTVVEL
ncbi:MAG: hypothetical protein E7226_04200 [Clostridiales bacterium]|nr:hypothetical protein [Clostridiales bacterium]